MSRIVGETSTIFFFYRRGMFAQKLENFNLLQLNSQRHSAYNLRNSEGRLTLSKPSTNYLKRSFSGAMLWNNLPKNLKNAASVEHFKRNIKKVADISDSHTAIM